MLIKTVPKQQLTLEVSYCSAQKKAENGESALQD